MKQILTGKQMKAVDADTINNIGIPGIVLMERAALSVASLMMEPMQIQIGDCIARSADQEAKKQKAGRKKNQKQLEAKLAFVENDSIFIETITRSLISEISIS